MKIEILKAFNGDSIHISFIENDIPRNILIDGGVGNTYKSPKNVEGSLFRVIKNIREKGEYIDLLVITHFDDDHIGGILRWLNKDKKASELIKKVWFNSGKEIAKKFESAENEDLNIKIVDGEDDFFSSTKQGIEFEKYLRDNSLWLGGVIQQGEEYNLYGLKFKILSPNNENLAKLLNKYEKQKDYFTKGGEYDFKTSLKEFIEEEIQPDFKFKEDKSVANGSSLAFIIDDDDKSYLFLGDSHPSTIIEGLNKFGYNKENPLNVLFVKVSHHGSRHNTSQDLLEILKTDKYLISADATKHGLPNKRTFARIINNNPNSFFYFNYDLKDKVFSLQDWKDYPDFRCKMQNEF